SILWGNGSNDEVHFAAFDDSSRIVLGYTDITGGIDGIVTSDNGAVTWLEGNRDQPPLFADSLNGDFGLTRNSPAVDAGTAFLTWEGDTLVRLNATEYLGAAPDLGALERAPDTVNYFPLTYRNEWLLETGTDSLLLRVLDSVVINQERYWVTDPWYPDEGGPDTFRVAGNRVWFLAGRDESLLYDFAAPLGAEWEALGPAPFAATMRLTGVNETVSTPAGIFTDCLEFERFIGSDYSYRDWLAPETGLVQRDVTTFAGTVRYQLVYQGPLLSISDETPGQPRTFAITRVYPNPFNPVTTIQYTLPRESDVRVSVFNLRGDRIVTLVNRRESAGSHILQWNGRNDRGRSVASGVYFLSVESSGVYRKTKLLLVK
ncbi:MAG: T9SS C-terminal target domain-containing protein, partial [Candidatus Neomarinimicrobiota bacterium]